jgi:hypothetical protein
MDSRVEKRLSGEDEPESMPGAERRVRAMIELVRPLVCGGTNPVVLDLFEDIVLPAQQSGWSEQLEIERLCAIFSMVLEQVGNAILGTLTTYLATVESEHTLKHFISAMEHLAGALAEAYDTSLIEAFRIGLCEGFCNEPF